MFKMTINVVVESVREAGENAKDAGYALLLFTGGKANINLNKEQFDQLKDKEDENLNIVFKMRVCEATNRYRKPTTGFEPVAILEIEE